MHAGLNLVYFLQVLTKIVTTMEKKGASGYFLLPEDTIQSPDFLTFVW